MPTEPFTFSRDGIDHVASTTYCQRLATGGWRLVVTVGDHDVTVAFVPTDWVDARALVERVSVDPGFRDEDPDVGLWWWPSGGSVRESPRRSF